MDNTKNDSFFIERIIKDINFILEHAGKLTLDDLSKDEVLIDSTLFRLVQIAENSNELSAAFIEKTQSLPWRQIRGLRNGIVHAYDVIRIDIVYETIKNDLRPFRDELLKHSSNYLEKPND